MIKRRDSARTKNSKSWEFLGIFWEWKYGNGMPNFTNNNDSDYLF